VRGTVEHAARIDEQISKHAQHWRMERMPVVDRNILRLAVFEMTHVGTPPPSPSTKPRTGRKFSNEESVQFVNGVLDAIRRRPLSLRFRSPDSRSLPSLKRLTLSRVYFPLEGRILHAQKWRSLYVLPLIVLVCSIAGGFYGPESRRRRPILRYAELDQDVANFTKVLAWWSRTCGTRLCRQGYLQRPVPGMLRTLDPHSNFFDPKEYQRFAKTRGAVLG